LLEEVGFRKEKPLSPLYGPGPFQLTRRYLRVDPKELFRFSAEQIEELAEALGLPVHIRTVSGHVVERSKAHSIVLLKLAAKTRYSQMVEKFKMQRGPLCETYLEVLALLSTQWARPFLAQIDIESFGPSLGGFSHAIGQKQSVLENVWGFIDGTLLRTCRPSKYQRFLYNGHHKHHGLKFLFVRTPDGIVRLCYGPRFGKDHDANLYRRSGLREDLEAAFGDPDQYGEATPKVFGDVAFPLSPYLFRGFRSTLGRGAQDPRTLFNREMASARIAVEWGIGYVKQLWASLNYYRDLKVMHSPVADQFLVAVFLTNCFTCMNPRENQTSSYFGVSPPSLVEYLNKRG